MVFNILHYKKEKNTLFKKKNYLFVHSIVIFVYDDINALTSSHFLILCGNQPYQHLLQLNPATSVYKVLIENNLISN